MNADNKRYDDLQKHEMVTYLFSVWLGWINFPA